MPEDFSVHPYDFNQIPMSNALLQQQQQSNALRSGLLPFQLEEAQRANALGQLQQELTKQDYIKGQVAQAAAETDQDDPEAAARQWDTNMERAAKAIEAAGGDPSFARQYVGKWSKERQDSIGRLYGGAGGGAIGGTPAGSVSTQRAPSTAPGQGLPGGLPSGFGPLGADQLTQMQQRQQAGGYEVGGGDTGLPGVQVTNQQGGYLQNYQRKLQHVAGELGRVLTSSNPQAEWDRIRQEDPEAAKLPEKVDLAQFKQMRQGLQAQMGQVGGLGAESITGAPTARTPVEVKETSQGGFAGIDRSNPAAPTVSTLQKPSFKPTMQVSGYTKDGRTIYYDTATGKETIGENQVEVGRYRQGTPAGGARGNTAAERFAADYERIHKDDDQYVNNPGKLREDADNFGRGFMKPPKDMSDVEINIAAARGAFGDPQLERQLKNEFIAAREADRARAKQATGPRQQLSNPPRPAGNQPLPPAAMKLLQEGKVTTFGNGQQWTVRGGVVLRLK